MSFYPSQEASSRQSLPDDFCTSDQVVLFVTSGARGQTVRACYEMQAVWCRLSPAPCLLAAGYTLLVKAPIELYNALPLPVHIGLNTSRVRQSSWRVTVQPLQTCLLTQGGAFEDVQTFQLEPIGYAASPTMQIPHAEVPTR